MAVSTHDEPDGGFTLIELLVVIIIIGILAAIAIPVFLNQRQKAWQSSVKSGLREVASFEETYAVDHSSYGTAANMQGDGLALKVSPGVTVTLVAVNGPSGYCLSGKHASDASTFWYDSNAGGLQKLGATGCPVTTAGVNGGSLSGS